MCRRCSTRICRSRRSSRPGSTSRSASSSSARSTTTWCWRRRRGRSSASSAACCRPRRCSTWRVNSNSERGLLSMALHPNFPGTPYAYIRWTESSTGADSGAVADVPAARQPTRSLHLERRVVRPRPQPRHAASAPDRQRRRARPPGLEQRRRERQSQRRRRALRTRRQALSVHGRPGSARLDAEPPERPVPDAAPGRRHLRRPGARQRPSLGRDPAPQRGRHDPGRQPVLRCRCRHGRRGRRQHPEGVLVRPSQWLRHGVRSVVRCVCGKPRTQTTPTPSSTASFPE